MLKPFFNTIPTGTLKKTQNTYYFHHICQSVCLQATLSKLWDQFGWNLCNRYTLDYAEPFWFWFSLVNFKAILLKGLNELVHIFQIQQLIFLKFDT